MQKDVENLERVIGYTFSNKTLLKTALTHSSYANERRCQPCSDNERLEFLGDAVLELVVSEQLFQRKPKLPEGEMTKTRASLVCEQTLDLCARKFGLENYLLLGKGEEATGGRNRSSIVSDAFEALIGAVYLDGGFASAKDFIQSFLLEDIEHLQLFCDSKTILQEMVQRDSSDSLSYVLLREEGPDHDKRYVVSAMLGDRSLGTGEGRSKKSAEQQAAYEAILMLQNSRGDKK